MKGAALMDVERVVPATWLCWKDRAVLAVRPQDAESFFLPGGVPEAAETPAQAAVREVREEVGVRIHQDRLAEAVRVEAKAHGRPGAIVELVCFVGPGEGDPVADGTEIVEVAWLEPTTGTGSPQRFALR